ncbi:hypothetical protein KKF81_04605 [Candidatus Micrarchaeota archaeon]|nr:hypothetical protein [Candidatus Micrarchaeota archaeon]MBU1166207.1 hypothetical protein [Candidatus Micrarchaeota archaeon]MBU1886949.1 hypothetical protein [Candidatus Micrarchaeota archaeon]
MKMKYGEMAFLGGIVLAVLIGLFSSYIPLSMLPIAMALLVVLGLVVGVMNVSEKEVQKFLIATIALLAATTSLGPLTTAMIGWGGIMFTLASWITGFLGALAAFIAPAAFVVALKAIYDMAQN